MTNPPGCQYLIDVTKGIHCGRRPTHHWTPRVGKEHYDAYVFCGEHHAGIDRPNWAGIYDYGFITHHFPYDD